MIAAEVRWNARALYGNVFCQGRGAPQEGPFDRSSKIRIGVVHVIGARGVIHSVVALSRRYTGSNPVGNAKSFQQLTIFLLL